MDVSSIFSTWFQTIHFLKLRYSDIPRRAVTRNTSCVSFRSNIFETHGTFVLLSVESSSGTNEVYISHPRLVTEHRDDHCSPSRHEIVEVEKKGEKKREWYGGEKARERIDLSFVIERTERHGPTHRFSRFHQTKMIPGADNARENTRLEIEGTQNMRIHNNLFAASALCLLSVAMAPFQGSLMQNSRVTLRGNPRILFKNPCIAPL